MRLVGSLLSALARRLPKRVAKKACDAFLDVVEDEVKASPSKWDDILVLPLCKIIRNIGNIPDNDED